MDGHSFSCNCIDRNNPYSKPFHTWSYLLFAISLVLILLAKYSTFLESVNQNILIFSTLSVLAVTGLYELLWTLRSLYGTRKLIAFILDDNTISSGEISFNLSEIQRIELQKSKRTFWYKPEINMDLITFSNEEKHVFELVLVKQEELVQLKEALLRIKK